MSTARPPKSAPGTKYEAVVESQLGRARQRIRLLDVGAAVLGLLAACLVYGLVISVVDSWLLLPVWFRQAAFVIFGLVTLAYIAGAVLPPLVRRVNPYYAAQQVERTIPDAKNSVVNWLDLKGQPLPPAIRGAVSQKAARDISQADLEEAISARRTSWLGGITAGLLVALAVLFFIAGPQQFRSLMGHAFLPFSSSAALTTRTTLELIQPEGGNVTVPAYHAVNFLVRVEGKIPRADSDEAIRLLYRYDRNGRYEELAFEPGDTNREWVAMIAGSDLHNGFWYRVQGGDYESPEYQVRVRSVPLLAGFQVHYHFPAYLRMADMASTNPNLHGMRGTDVKVVARANCMVRDGVLEVLGQKQTVAGEVVENKQALRFRLRLEQNGRYRIHFTSVEGDTNPDTSPYTITVLSDLPPQVRITRPEKAEIHLPLNGVLKVEGQATDDFGLTGLRLQMRINGEPARTIPYRPGKTWRRADGSYPLTLDYADVVDVAKLKLKDGQPLQKGMAIDFWLEATDNCAYPPPGPNVGRSQPTYRVILDDPQSPQAAQEQKQKAQKEKQQKQQAQDQKLSKQAEQQNSAGKGNQDKPDQSGADGQKPDAAQNPPKAEQNQQDKNSAGSGKSSSQSGQQGSDKDNHQQGDTHSSEGNGEAGNKASEKQQGSKANQQGTDKNAQEQANGQEPKNGSGQSGQNAKNDLEKRLQKAQEWLNKHKQDNTSAKPDKRNEDKNSQQQANNGGNSNTGTGKPSGAKNSSSAQDSHPDKNQQSGDTPKSTGQQNGSKPSGDHKQSNPAKHGQQQGDKQPGAHPEGSQNQEQSTGKEPDKQQGSGAHAGKQPRNSGDNKAANAGNENHSDRPKGNGAEQAHANSGDKSADTAAGKQPEGTGQTKKPSAEEGSNPKKGSDKGSSGASRAIKKPGKKSDSAAGTDEQKGAQRTDGNPTGAPKNGHDKPEPGKGGNTQAAQPSAGQGHKSDRTDAATGTPKGKQPGDTGTGAHEQSGKQPDNGANSKPAQPKAQAADKGSSAEQQPGHNAPDHGPTSKSQNEHANQPKGDHTAATGGKPDSKQAEQRQVEKDLSDALKQLQQKDDRQLSDLMKKLQSQDPSTRSQAGRQLEDKIRQAAQNPQVRKQAEDLLKRLQRLSQESQPKAPGTANANGTKGEHAPTGHEGSQHQAGNSSSQVGDKSTAGQTGSDAQAKNNSQPADNNPGKGSSPGKAGEQGDSQSANKNGQPSKGQGGPSGNGGKGGTANHDTTPQHPGDSTGPGPGDGTHANGNRTGTGSGSFQPGDADPANKDFQKKAGELQLQQFPKNPPKDLLRDLHLTEKDWEALRKAQAEMIRQRRQQTNHDTLPARGSGGHGLKDLKAHQIKSGTQEQNLDFTGATHPPPGFGDTYREFTQKGSKLPGGK